MKKIIYSIILTLMLGFCRTVVAQSSNRIDADAIIEQVLAVAERQSDKIQDVTFEAESLRGKYDDKKGFQQESRFTKKVFLKYLPDTVLYADEFLEYYDGDDLQTPKKRDEAVAELREKRKKRKAHNVSFSMMTPFEKEHRAQYDISYIGIAEEKIEGYVCHHFKVLSKEEDEMRINGDYYFEADTFHLVRVDFEPAKLVKKLMFKLKELRLSLRYGPTDEGYWLPRQFDVRGKGKAAFFIGVNFASVEYFRNPQINTGLDDKLFEVKDD